MEYFDPYNFPGLALRVYEIDGGEVVPNLFNGTIFRVLAEESFEFDRLKNQIDGAKFFLEIYNSTDSAITISFNEDYRATNFGTIDDVTLEVGGVVAYECICRIGLLFVYGQEGLLPSEEGDTLEWTDGFSYFRIQVRSGSLFLDQTRTGTGFDGDEGYDWDSIWSKKLSV